MNKTPSKNQEKRVFEPIRNLKDLERIRASLSGNYRNLLLFDLAVQTGAGMKKLLHLKVKNLLNIPSGGEIMAIKKLRGKAGFIMTDLLHETFQGYLDQFKPKQDDYLFKSNKGNEPLKLSSVSNMIKGWFSDAAIEGNFGAISLRKTWEFHYSEGDQQGETSSKSGLDAIFAPIQTPSAQKVVYNNLINAIISGKIPPGTRLTTTEISKSFNVSHAPVRVALNWLEAKGFIEAQKKRGSIVKELSIDELHEIIKVRIILESAAMKIAYKAFSEDTLEALTAIAKRYKNAYTFEETDPLNREFHLTLYRDANMPLLVRLIADLYDRFSPYAAVSYSRTGAIPEHDRDDKLPTDHYHVKILDALRSKNLKELLKKLKTKIDRATLITEEILKERRGRDTK